MGLRHDITSREASSSSGAGLTSQVREAGMIGESQVWEAGMMGEVIVRFMKCVVCRDGICLILIIVRILKRQRSSLYR